ncbi:MAG: iron-sulfur cluster assembly accessory protein, partial [Moraxella sp.]|nr:iron-sulfur cluster assembly accessory protein [Moraxella sp.]
MNNLMTLTDNAAAKLAKLKAAENNDALMLRIYVTGGGCSGFSYGFDFAEEIEEDDATFLNGNETLVVDSLSYQY